MTLTDESIYWRSDHGSGPYEASRVVQPHWIRGIQDRVRTNLGIYTSEIDAVERAIRDNQRLARKIKEQIVALKLRRAALKRPTGTGAVPWLTLKSLGPVRPIAAPVLQLTMWMKRSRWRWPAPSGKRSTTAAGRTTMLTDDELTAIAEIPLHGDVPRLVAEFRALRAENERCIGLLRSVLDGYDGDDHEGTQPVYAEGEYLYDECAFGCPGDFGYLSNGHADDCPYRRARAALDDRAPGEET